jgi:monofunctional biosynthetic peptidoglycan transglycosylase
MGRALRLAMQAVLLGGGLFVLWLFAVWPPPVWYRTHWPEETAFQSMRASGPRLNVPVADSAKRYGLQAEQCHFGGYCPEVTIRLYFPMPRTAMAEWVEAAVIAGEDQRFRDHGGIDWVNLRRALGYPRERFSWDESRDRVALWTALDGAWEHRDALRGASTLTQQLAKNLWLSPSRNPLRKLKEAVAAYHMEAVLSKDRILELYLNVAELGPEIWGVEAASWYYFGRSADQLSLDQSAAIAGMLPFPLRSNPAFRPGRMQHRQRLILRLLRGEEVEIPIVPEEELAPIPIESLPQPIIDSLAPMDSLPPVLPDSLPSDSIPVDSASPPDSSAGTDSTGAGRR